jgi:GNAT superfamily N-acetyltransferase
MTDSLLLTVRPISARDTHDLRLRVLRPGQPPERADYQVDADPSAFHLGAFSEVDIVVGVASLYHELFPLDSRLPTYDTPHTDWRLRGMAVEPSLQGQGVGRALIDAALVALRERGATWLWCNARVTAEPFYTALGFATYGDPFEMADIGTHYLMARRV